MEFVSTSAAGNSGGTHVDPAVEAENRELQWEEFEVLEDVPPPALALLSELLAFSPNCSTEFIGMSLDMLVF